MSIRLLGLLCVSFLFVFTGCNSNGSKGDLGPMQLLAIVNDYRQGQSLPPLVYDAELAAVAQAYAQWLDNQAPAHQFPYSENADGKGLSTRLTDAGISVSASEEVGRSNVTITNAQLFFNSLTTTELATISRTDVDRIGIGHVSPPRGFTYNHYWVLDLIRRTTP